MALKFFYLKVYLINHISGLKIRFMPDALDVLIKMSFCSESLLFPTYIKTSPWVFCTRPFVRKGNLSSV